MASRGRKNADSVLLVALAAGRTVQDAARAGGVSERTVARRLADPAFAARLHAARAAAFDRALSKLAFAATKAVDSLVKLAANGPPAVRLGAARAILELGTRFRESVEFESRIARLETGELSHSISLEEHDNDAS